jgi:D-mannonate dehydratase
MEYFEKLTGQSEKLRKEMERANRTFTERKDLWRKCSEKRETFDERRQRLLEWLAEAESRISTIPSNEASETGKAITDFAILAKEIATRTSPEEGALIQGQADEVIKKWKQFVRNLAENKTPAMSKDLERLVHWVDTSLVIYKFYFAFGSYF